MSDPIVITTVQQLEGINNNLSGNYVLGADLDLSGINFIPIGDAQHPFTGTFNGAGYTISNLVINAGASSDHTGLFADLGTGGLVENVGLIGETVIGGSHVGGLVGVNAGSLSEVFVTGSITGNADVGGLVGQNVGSISNSFSTATLDGNAIGNEMGGLTGNNTPPGAITDSYSIGQINNYSSFFLSLGYVGGLAGPSGVVTNSYWDIDTSGLSQSNGGVGLTTGQLESGLPAGFDPTVWGSNPNVNGGFPYLLWQVAAPTVITTVQQLEGINNNLSGNYVLGADLDLSGISFVPIGDPEHPFTGTLDGKGHTISNLIINLSSTSHVGLFSYLGPGSLVEALNLTNVSVSGDGDTGALAGVNAGTILQASVSGSVHGSDSTGGLVGDGLGTIEQSFSTAAVIGNTEVGGLVGGNDSAETILQCYATGLVSGSAWVGGLLGIGAFGTVSQSYVLGPLGLTGGGDDFGNVITISNSYSNPPQEILPPGFDPTVWASNPNINNGFPYLLWQYPAPLIDARNSVLSGTVNKVADQPASSAPDQAQGKISFTDNNLSTTTATKGQQTLTLTNTQGQTENILSSISAADISALEAAFTLGSVTSGGEGSVDWTYSIANNQLNWLGVGQILTLTSTVQINDGQGDPAVPATVTVTINGADDLPVATPEAAYVQKGGSVSGNLSFTDVVIEDVPDLSVTKVAAPAVPGSSPVFVAPGGSATILGNYGTLTLHSNGSYSYNETQPLKSAASSGAIDTFTYTVDDGHGGQTVSTISITITPNPPAMPIHNAVMLSDGAVAVEMIKLAVDAYPFGDTGYHSFDPFGTPLAQTNPQALSDIHSDNWHLLTSNELGLHSLNPGQGLEYTFKNGLYQAINVSDRLGNDPSEADALVLTGVVNGKKTLAISFAGTDQKSDWMDYANFADHYAKFAALVSAVKAFIDTGAIDQVYVSGHSLGAAMAQDFMEDPVFKNDPHFQAQAFTIGSPGSDNIAFDTPDSRITNFYHALDPIFQVPAFSQAITAQTALGAGLEAEISTEIVPGLEGLGFSQQEADVVAANLLDNLRPKGHDGTNVLIPFGQPIDPSHVKNILGTPVDFDTHDALGYLQDVETYYSSMPNLAPSPQTLLAQH